MSDSQGKKGRRKAEGPLLPDPASGRMATMQTVRQEIISLLQEQEMNARELSQALHIMEKEVYDHLEHIGRTIGRQGMKLAVTPYACMHCGYTFAERRRWTRPGRCPACRQGHIRMASYRIAAA